MHLSVRERSEPSFEGWNSTFRQVVRYTKFSKTSLGWWVGVSHGVGKGYDPTDYDSGAKNQLTVLVAAKGHRVDAQHLSVQQGACLPGSWSFCLGESEWIRLCLVRSIHSVRRLSWGFYQWTCSLRIPHSTCRNTKTKKMSSALNMTSKKKAWLFYSLP